MQSMRLKPLTVFATLIAVLLCFAKAAFADEEIIGFIRTASPDAFLLRNGETLAPAVGDVVYRTDTVEVGSRGALGITFVDNTILSFGPNTNFLFVDYRFEPLEEDFSFLGRIIRGTFVYISGDIGAFADDGVRIETPMGIIGIRGTRFAGSADGSAQ